MREKITRLPKWAVILITLAIVAGFLLILNLAGFVLSFIPRIDRLSVYTSQMIAELCAGIYALGMLKLLGYGSVIREKGAGFVKGFYIGGFLVAYCCFSFVAQFYVQFMDKERCRQPLAAILIFIVTMFLVGWTEEAIFRGIVLNLLLDRFSKTKGGILAAIILDGVIFGFMHMANLFSGASPESACVQALTAAMLGILLAAVYARTRNIWIVILAHSLIDFASLLSSGIYGKGDLISGINDISVINLVSIPVLLIPAIILLRRSKLEELALSAKGQPVYLTEKEAGHIATVSVILGVISLLISCVGYGLGISIVGVLGATISLKSKPQNNGRATAGFVLSAIGLSIAVMAFFILCFTFSMAGNTSALNTLLNTEALFMG